MTKQRIVTNGKAFRIQTKFLWFWINYEGVYFELHMAEY
ncbi:hypothetical protein LCGC14_1920540, partial [marine sediment metagenome]